MSNPMLQPGRRPNVIFIVADDLGYADLGCYGGRAPVSPVLDRLASDGMLLTQGYSNSPVCSPTVELDNSGSWPYVPRDIGPTMSRAGLCPAALPYDEEQRPGKGGHSLPAVTGP